MEEDVLATTSTGMGVLEVETIVNLAQVHVVYLDRVGETSGSQESAPGGREVGVVGSTGRRGGDKRPCLLDRLKVGLVSALVGVGFQHPFFVC